MNYLKLPLITLGVGLSSVLLIFGSTVSASSFQSGPSGSPINGVYLDSTKLSFSLQSIKDPAGVSTRSGGTYSYGSCDDAPSECSFFPTQGKHSYKIYQNQYGDLYYSVDSGPGIQMGGWDVTDSAVYQVLFNQTITVDKDKPEVYLFNPPNNSNTSESSIEVSGMAADENDSGIAYVMVNSVKVNVDAHGAFSTTTSLVKGLNTIEVYSVDNAGRNSSVIRQTVNSTATTAQSPQSNSSSTSGNNKTETNPDKVNGSSSDVGGDTSRESNNQNKESEPEKSGRNIWLIILPTLLVIAGVVFVLIKTGLLTVDKKKIGKLKKALPKFGKHKK